MTSHRPTNGPPLTLKEAAALLLVGLSFFVVLTPVAIILRWLGRDALQLRFQPQADSYWIKRKKARPNHLRDQF